MKYFLLIILLSVNLVVAWLIIDSETATAPVESDTLNQEEVPMSTNDGGMVDVPPPAEGDEEEAELQESADVPPPAEGDEAGVEVQESTDPPPPVESGEERSSTNESADAVPEANEEAVDPVVEAEMEVDMEAATDQEADGEELQAL